MGRHLRRASGYRDRASVVSREGDGRQSAPKGLGRQEVLTRLLRPAPHPAGFAYGFGRGTIWIQRWHRGFRVGTEASALAPFGLSGGELGAQLAPTELRGDHGGFCFECAMIRAPQAIHGRDRRPGRSLIRASPRRRATIQRRAPEGCALSHPGSGVQSASDQ
jgi:hypothetical protein